MSYQLPVTNYQLPITYMRQISFTIENLLKIFLRIFLFLLPWQTVWIYGERLVNGYKDQYGTLQFFASEFLLWVVVLLFMYWFWKKYKVENKKYKFKITKDRIFVFSCFLFIVYAFASVLWSYEPDRAFQQAFHILEAFLLFFVIFLGPLKIRETLKWFVFGSVAPAVLGIAQVLLQDSWPSTLLGLPAHDSYIAGSSIVQGEDIGRWLRAYGTFSHPNVFGGYIVIVIVMLFLLTKKWKVESGGYKVFFLTSYLLLLTALFFTFSRSAWLAMLVSFLVYCYITFRKMGDGERGTGAMFIIPTIFLITFLSIVYFPVIQVRFSQDSYNEIQSVQERMSGYEEASILWQLRPFYGVGAGNYTAAAYTYNDMLEGWNYQPVHNVGLLFLVEFGVAGIVLLFFVVVSFISLQSFKTLNFFWYMICCGTCYVILAGFDHYLLSSYIGLLLTAIYLAIVVRLSPSHPPSVPRKE